MDKHTTLVLFRKDKEGKVLAVLPCVSGSTPHHCVAYRHTNIYEDVPAAGIIERTRPASPIEYREVLEDLQDLGYNVLVANKYTPYMRGKRIREYKFLNTLDI